MTTLGYYARFNMPQSTIQAAARAAEESGFSCLWINNPPGQDGLTPVAWAAAATGTIGLGTGVVPVSQHAPGDVLAAVRRLGLPLERYRLGIGSGTGEHPRDRVRAALRELRPQAGCELVVGALGPLMCTLAGEEADAVFLVAVTPALARRSAELVRASAQAAGRPAPRVYAGVLVGLGDEGRASLGQVAEFYTRMPFYAAHLERMGLPPTAVSITARDVRELGDGLANWRGVVDELIVGPLPDPQSAEDIVRLVGLIREAWQASAS